MAKFKKIPDSQSGDSIFDQSTAEMLGEFATSYWPAVVSGLILFVLVFRSYGRLAYLSGIVMVLLLAWWFGVKR